jgi:hypothetical protein
MTPEQLATARTTIFREHAEEPATVKSLKKIADAWYCVCLKMPLEDWQQQLDFADWIDELPRTHRLSLGWLIAAMPDTDAGSFRRMWWEAHLNNIAPLEREPELPPNLCHERREE